MVSVAGLVAGLPAVGVLDEQEVVLREQAAERRGTRLAERRAEGILSVRCDDERVEAAGEGALERGGIRAVVVERDRHRPQVHGMEQVEQPRKGGILDPDPIAGPQVRLEHALEPLQGAAGEAQRRRVDAGAPELRAGVGDEGLGLGVLLVARDVGASRGHAAQRRGRLGHEHRVRDARREVAHAGRRPARPRRPRLRLRRDARATAAVADHEAALAQQAVGRGRRARVDAALARQRAHGREPPPASHLPGADAPLEVERDALCAAQSRHIVRIRYRNLY